MATPSTSRNRARAAGRKAKKLEPGTLAHFDEFCRRFIVLEDGATPFILEAFQKLILRAYFAGVTEILVLLPKKNGKTTLLAALAIYHLIYTPNAACYIAASARDQAKIMYDQACGFIERKGPDGKLLPQAQALQKRVLLRKGSKEIRSRRDSGFIWVLSGDKNTADGVIPTLALVDELHRHKDNGQLYGVLRDGLGPRDGQLITISTAGERIKSALGRIRDKAMKFPGVKRAGALVHARSPDGDFEMFEWSLKADEDRENLTVVKKANPLSTNTIDKLRARKNSPSMTASRWARFGCGVWMEGDDAAMGALTWSRAGKTGRQIPRGTGIYLGADFGWTWDTTALVPLWAMNHDPDPSKINVRLGTPRILVPPGDGTRLSKEKVVSAILSFRDDDGYEILGVVFDRNAEGETVAQELENEHGIRVIEHSQDPSTMADASMGFAQAVGEGRVEHPNDPELTAHIRAAIARTVSGVRWRFDAPAQNRGQRKQGTPQDQDLVDFVDAAIATAMVHHTAVAEASRKPVDRAAYRMEFA